MHPLPFRPCSQDCYLSFHRHVFLYERRLFKVVELFPVTEHTFVKSFAEEEKAPWLHPAGRRSVRAASTTSQQGAGDRLASHGPHMSGRRTRGRKLAARTAALLPRPLPSGEAAFAFREMSNVPFSERTLHRVRRWQVSRKGGGIQYTSITVFFCPPPLPRAVN